MMSGDISLWSGGCPTEHDSIQRQYKYRIIQNNNKNRKYKNNKRIRSIESSALVHNNKRKPAPSRLGDVTLKKINIHYKVLQNVH
jgi:hypothetical protein